MATNPRQLVLIGAGHTNLHIVQMWKRQPIPNVELTLISAFDRATYSGMLPGTLAGLYTPKQMQIDLVRLADRSNTRLIISKAIGLDGRLQHVKLADGTSIPFDVASVGIGSIPSHQQIWEKNPSVLSIKPMATFLSRLDERLGLVTKSLDFSVRERPFRICIVGAGAAGIELAFCLDVLLRSRGIPAGITILDASREILRGYAERTVRLAHRELDARGIFLQLGVPVIACHETNVCELELVDGTTIGTDLVLWATAAAPPTVLEGFNLPKTERGFLAIRPTLQTTGDVPVFVVGDTADFVDRKVPKAGVYAVREGPILWNNLRRFLSGRPLISYKPQQGFLSLLSTGDGRAILQYHGLSFHGRWCWKLKDWIDRRFVQT